MGSDQRLPSSPFGCSPPSPSALVAFLGAPTVIARPGRQWIRLRETAPPKAGSWRRVPISDELVRLLLGLKICSADKTGPVFSSRTGSRLSHRNVERRGFDTAASDAGLEGVTLHDLRHAYGSAARLARAQRPPDRRCDGAKKTSTTEIYIQRSNGEAADDRVREAMSG